MTKKDKYNSSGYLDMTAYLAMKNIEREEAERRDTEQPGKKKKRRKSKGRGKKKPD